ncbi:MAG: hypothetical protein AMS23_01315 [Bacteroides sp. SM1_62]|nr:MAG: hypothetical protein AMS23_01315 [Bacteroides sp. SM1_62]
MRSLKNIVTLFCMAWMLPSCIEEYMPDIETLESNKYVVFGELTTEQEDHIVSVALASSIQEPKYMPLSECFVRIVDRTGKSFEGDEFEGGKYVVRIPPENILPGMAYQLEILTPAGTSLVSEYEELLDSPAIDSVYYIRENIATNNPEHFIEGIQFYLDLDAPGAEHPYYKFDVIETFEYHSELPLEYYYDGVLHHIDPPDSSHMVCWATHQIKDIFILNTAGLQENAYKRFLLHFVDNTTQRLKHLYSILVKQYAIDEPGYVYWDQVRQNNLEQGSMYETQPLPAKGNLVNLTNPEQEVLGYFQVSSVKTNRIFVKDVPDLDFNFYPECGIWLLFQALQFYDPRFYPVYLATIDKSIREVSPDCIFCEMSILGGTTTKPDFWPE